jgi:hypothetical protein
MQSYEVRVVDSAGDPERRQVGGFTQSGRDRTQSSDARCSARAMIDAREDMRRNCVCRGKLLGFRSRAPDKGLKKMPLRTGSPHPVGPSLYAEGEAGRSA